MTQSQGELPGYTREGFQSEAKGPALERAELSRRALGRLGLALPAALTLGGVGPRVAQAGGPVGTLPQILPASGGVGGGVCDHAGPG